MNTIPDATIRYWIALANLGELEPHAEQMTSASSLGGITTLTFAFAKSGGWQIDEPSLVIDTRPEFAGQRIAIEFEPLSKPVSFAYLAGLIDSYIMVRNTTR